MRIFATILVAVWAATATADVLVIKKGKRFQVIGLKSKIGGVEIDHTNYKAYIDQSDGIVTRDGYDAIWFKKSDRRSAKEVRYDIKDVIDVRYSTEPDAMLDGFDLQSTGSWAQAIGAFRDVKGDTSARPVYRIEADYRIGICYLLAGSRANASRHFAAWKVGNSRYTPQVYRIMAELLTGAKKYASARKWYARIGALEDITKGWKLTSRLGDVKVDIQERKFNAAEGKANALLREIGGDKELNDVLALASALRARAILASENKDRLGEAQKILESAAELKGVSATNMAEVYSALGDAIYRQGRPEEARFSYMRVVCLFPGEAGYVANALLDAGQCFLDMSGRQRDDQKASDELLMQGMKLLAECAGRHRGSAAARQAKGIYRKRKKDMEAARTRLGG